MTNDKNLGKVVDEGDYIELNLGLEAGKYQFRFNHKTAKPTRNITILNDNDIVMIPNFNGRKSLFEGQNWFIIYRYEGTQKVRVSVDNFNRWLIFLNAKVSNVTNQITHLIYKDNNEKYFLSYMKDGDLHIDECNLTDYPNALVLNYPY